MRTLGVPYTDEEIARAAFDADQQGQRIAEELAQGGVTVAPDSEIVALIAYLQSLGLKAPPPDDTPTKPAGVATTEVK
jgi:cytochrome c oxidase cbb3-type subunit I/II